MNGNININSNIEIGNRLRKLLEINNMTQAELAKKMDTTTATLSRYVTGKRQPKGEIVAKMAYLLNTTSDYILTGKESDESELNNRDKKDIEKDLKKIMDDFRDGESGPAFYDGVELDDDDLEKLEIAMRTALEIAKVKNKEKYTPKKYKKDK